MCGYCLSHPKGASALLLLFLLVMAGAAAAQPPPSQPPAPRAPETRVSGESTEVTLHKIEGDETTSVGKIFVRSGGSSGGIRAEVGKGGDSEDHPSIDINVDAGDEGNDIVRFGEDITIEEGRTVSGDVVAVGGSVKVMGEVIGDVVAVGGNVRVGTGAVVEGDAVSVGGRVFEDEGSQVRGSNVSVSIVPSWIFGSALGSRGHREGLHSFGSAFSWLVATLVVLFFGWLVVMILGRRMTLLCEYMRQRWGLSLAVGFLVMLLFLPAFVVLCITIIGIPIALLLPFALGLATFFGFIAGAARLGHFVLQRAGRGTGSLVRAMSAGVVLLFVILLFGALFRAIGGPLSFLGGLLNLIGWVGIAIGSLSGLGALVLGRMGSRLPPAEAVSAMPPPPIAAEPPVSPA
jgi:hypothetical protein